MTITPRKPEITEDDITVVLIGDFNPVIFHPAWLAQTELIRHNEANDAKIEVIVPDISSFSLEWISFQILRNSFTATIKADAYKTHLGDITQGIFTILSHTPIRQMGINTNFRTQFKTSDDWHNFGHYLTPKSAWSGVLSQPGMRGVQMQGIRDDGKRGYVVVSVEPELVNNRDTVFIRVNDHYDRPLTAENETIGATWAVEILKEKYQGSIEKAKEITENLINRYIQGETEGVGTNSYIAEEIEAAEEVEAFHFPYQE